MVARSTSAHVFHSTLEIQDGSAKFALFAIMGGGSEYREFCGQVSEGSIESLTSPCRPQGSWDLAGEAGLTGAEGPGPRTANRSAPNSAGWAMFVRYPRSPVHRKGHQLHDPGTSPWNVLQ